MQGFVTTKLPIFLLICFTGSAIIFVGNIEHQGQLSFAEGTPATKNGGGSFMPSDHSIAH